MGVLSTPLLKSTSTARWVTRAHGRALTIIAERPTSLNTNVGKCRSVRRPIFPQFPVLFVLRDTCKTKFLVIHKFRKGMWNVKMRGRPDGLFGVAQIMLCVSENSPRGRCRKKRHDRIMTIFGASKNVPRRSIQKVQKDSSTGCFCHKRDSFSLCPRS